MLHFFLKKKKTWRYHYFKPVYQKSQYYLQQALAYETCDCTQMPLHTPKTLETCKKSMPCLIKKASRCVIDRMSKTKNVVYLSLSIKHKDLTRKSCVFICYFIGSVVKIVLHSYFLYIKDDRLQRIRKKHEWWNNRFSDVFTYRLNLKNSASLFFLIQDNFMF